MRSIRANRADSALWRVGRIAIVALNFVNRMDSVDRLDFNNFCAVIAANSFFLNFGLVLSLFFIVDHFFSYILFDLFV